MTLDIQIIGANCSKCEKLLKRFEKVVAEFQIDAFVTKSSEIKILIAQHVFTIPSVLINDVVVSKGTLLSEKQIIRILNDHLPHDKQIVLPVKTKRIMDKKQIQLFVIIAIFLSVCLCCIFFIHVHKSKKALTENPISSNKVSLNIADSIDGAFNYNRNKQSYSLTFLEFGSTGCQECKKMETVMETVKENYKTSVNVVFYNVRKKENKKMTEHYGIQMIPVQILLDKNGKECFRHVGYFSFEELTFEFKQFGVQN